MPGPASRRTALPRYQWNAGLGRFIDARSGRMVPFKDVRNALERVMQAGRRNIRQYSEALVNGDITLAQWQRGMAAEIKTLHVTAALSAKGGYQAMAPRDWALAEREIERQMRYLSRFKDDIRSGDQELDGRLVTRADLYGQAPRGTFEELKRATAEVKAYNAERRVLGVADHCATCLVEAGKGWQPLGTLRRIGDSECVTNCHCEFVFKYDPRDAAETAYGI